MGKTQLAVLISLSMILALGLKRAVLNSNMLSLQKIEIMGASTSTSVRIQKLLTSKIGDSLWHLQLEGEIARVKTDPWVESATTERRWPNTLVIQVIERKPVAVLGNKFGKFEYVDKTGFVIDEAKSTDIGSYPTLLGQSFTQIDLRKRAIDLLKTLPSEGLVSQKDISDLEFDKTKGFLLRLTKTGILLNVGKQNLPLHIDRARRVVQYLDQHGLDATLVDADYAKKVLVKVRQRR